MGSIPLAGGSGRKYVTVEPRSGTAIPSLLPFVSVHVLARNLLMRGSTTMELSIKNARIPYLHLIHKMT